MPREGSKAERIMTLYAAGKSTREIADTVGCRIEYVRVVARQRNGSSTSSPELRYRESPLGRDMRRRVNERNREARKAYYATLYRTADQQAVIDARKRAYRAAIERGADSKTATSVSTSAASRVIKRTGDRAAARAAYGAVKEAAHA